VEEKEDIQEPNGKIYIILESKMYIKYYPVFKRIRNRADLQMDTKTIIVLQLAIFWMHSVQSDVSIPNRFNCHNDVPAQTLKLESVS